MFPIVIPILSNKTNLSAQLLRLSHFNYNFMPVIFNKENTVPSLLYIKRTTKNIFR